MNGSEIVLLGVFGTLMVLGIPFAFSIGISVFAALWAENIDLVVVPQQLQSGMSVYTLLSIPCFILAGDLMFTVGLTHPPLGYTLFTASAVSGVPVDKIIKPLIPLVAIELVPLMLITYIPDLSLFLMHMFY